MSHQNSCQHKKTRPIAAGLIIALAGPPLGLLPNLLWSAVGLPLGKFPSAVLGVPGFAYVMLGLPAIHRGIGGRADYLEERMGQLPTMGGGNCYFAFGVVHLAGKRL